MGVLVGVVAVAGALAGCGPAPGAVVAPAPTVAPVVASAAPSATASPAVGPKAALPALHPCVPDFIQKELHACEPGAATVDYSDVANAMAAMAAAGPTGPRPREKKPVPRALLPLEEKAASTARAFLCKPTAGDPDDQHATTAFDVGRLYLAANHFEEAALFLRDVALLDPRKHDEVQYAARFLLEAMRALAQARPECAGSFPALATAVDAHVCQGAGAADRAESCAVIAKMQQDGAGPPP